MSQEVSKVGGDLGQARYASFWQRLGAQLVDFLILSPISLLLPYLARDIRLFHVYSLLPVLIFALFYEVYLVQRYGGTLGKLALKIRIALVDGSPVTAKAAGLRFSVMFVLSLLSAIGMVVAVLSVSDEVFLSASGLDRHRLLEDYAPSWFRPLGILTGIWVWSEFITMLLNERRRAIHDFIGGTVVVRAD